MPQLATGDAVAAESNSADGVAAAAGSRYPTSPVPRALAADAPSASPCEPGPTTHCLPAGRFRVEVEWQDFQGGSRNPGGTFASRGDTTAF